MKAQLTSVFAVAGLLFAALPGRAQYAFMPVAKAPVEARDTEDGPRASTYKVVHGVVQDRKGALPGATVWLHGSRTIVVTNSEGEFELRVPADAKLVELTCSYGGLQEEVVRFAPSKALGSVYLLRSKGNQEPASQVVAE